MAKKSKKLSKQEFSVKTLPSLSKAVSCWPREETPETAEKFVSNIIKNIKVLVKNFIKRISCKYLS